MSDSVNPFSLRWGKFANGERMPFLVSTETGIPLEGPTYWIIADRRALGMQPKTLANELRALSYLYLWAAARDIDVALRLSEGVFFSLSEIMDIANFCGLYVADAIKQIASASSKVVPISTRRTSNRVQSVEKRNRLTALRRFIEFTSADFLSLLSAWPQRWSHYNAVRSECLKTLDGQRKGLVRRNNDDVGQREGLAEDVIKRLRDVIEPDHPENPFNPKVRLRNYLIVLIFLNLGVRRGELGGVMVADCSLGSKGTLTIHRRPDDPNETRSTAAATKTAARVLPLGGRLTELLHEWITQHRSKIPGARLHPYLIVSSETGKPMSLSNFNKIIDRLRQAVPGLPKELTPHILRHSWNDWFSEESDRKGFTEENEVKWRKRLMGWRSEDSASHYLRRTIRRRSNTVLETMQNELMVGKRGPLDG
ncbi:tyrosine-type recombinase/integrase [Rhizobium ruizarguesonis]|uniref:tyrosine-type recombinase/integrase n=1 Tax=Rhizobium ruizarguesonis TaxID=2081791 RepID=UPI0013C7123E|nr:site-specific integrase [Rhizobium ruizarguesonis]NEH27461.1 tyrosine-type recombinase/integrase [Rhizobium ruizarguesonis]